MSRKEEEESEYYSDESYEDSIKKDNALKDDDYSDESYEDSIKRDKNKADASEEYSDETYEESIEKDKIKPNSNEDYSDESYEESIEKDKIPKDEEYSDVSYEESIEKDKSKANLSDDYRGSSDEKDINKSSVNDKSIKKEETSDYDSYYSTEESDTNEKEHPDEKLNPPINKDIKKKSEHSTDGDDPFDTGSDDDLDRELESKIDTVKIAEPCDSKQKELVEPIVDLKITEVRQTVKNVPENTIHTDSSTKPKPNDQPASGGFLSYFFGPKKPVFKLFGVPPSTYMPDEEIPIFLEEMIQYIEKKKESEGIFRKAGLGSKITALCEKLDKNEPVNYTEWNIDVIAGVLKKLLRETPEPIIPTSTYIHLKDLSMTESKKDVIENVKNLFIKEIPRCDYILLKRIIKMCILIEASKEKNLMTVENLVIVLAPNLVREAGKNSDPGKTLLLMGLGRKLIESFILYYDDIFDL